MSPDQATKSAASSATKSKKPEPEKAFADFVAELQPSDREQPDAEAEPVVVPDGVAVQDGDLEITQGESVVSEDLPASPDNAAEMLPPPPQGHQGSKPVPHDAVTAPGAPAIGEASKTIKSAMTDSQGVSVVAPRTGSLQEHTSATTPEPPFQTAGPPSPTTRGETAVQALLLRPGSPDGQRGLRTASETPRTEATHPRPASGQRPIVAPTNMVTAAATLSPDQSRLPLSPVQPDTQDLPEDLGEAPQLVQPSAARTAHESMPPSAVPHRASGAELARSIASQISASVAARAGGGIELQLNPEELGRISITMMGREDGIHLVISAERPETLDLMRRHISLLSTEFQQLGYGGLDFDSNGAAGSETHEDARHQGAFQTDADPGSPDTDSPAPRRPDPSRSLDLRL
ncbi:flagellar hook-length control protein FliK [Ruegeria intermedia]|uniref:flagellar hook-length control protein FliK n=1 Tax=Ruegeria intermedia TaxID=996115 RepID=UPI00165FCDA3|nr:flagellar hook-length control protein FliK [Ruegeria intermedia]